MTVHPARGLPFDAEIQRIIADNAGQQLVAIVRQYPDLWSDTLKRHAAIDYIHYVCCGKLKQFVNAYEILHEDDKGTIGVSTRFCVPWLTSTEITQLDDCITAAVFELEFNY